MEKLNTNTEEKKVDDVEGVKKTIRKFQYETLKSISDLENNILKEISICNARKNEKQKILNVLSQKKCEKKISNSITNKNDTLQQQHQSPKFIENEKLYVVENSSSNALKSKANELVKKAKSPKMSKFLLKNFPQKSIENDSISEKIPKKQKEKNVSNSKRKVVDFISRSTQTKTMNTSGFDQKKELVKKIQNLKFKCENHESTIENIIKTNHKIINERDMYLKQFKNSRNNFQIFTNSINRNFQSISVKMQNEVKSAKKYWDAIQKTKDEVDIHEELDVVKYKTKELNEKIKGLKWKMKQVLRVKEEKSEKVQNLLKENKILKIEKKKFSKILECESDLKLCHEKIKTLTKQNGKLEFDIIELKKNYFEENAKQVEEKKKLYKDLTLTRKRLKMEKDERYNFERSLKNEYTKKNDEINEIRRTLDKERQNVEMKRKKLVDREERGKNEKIERISVIKKLRRRIEDLENNVKMQKIQLIKKYKKKENKKRILYNKKMEEFFENEKKFKEIIKNSNEEKGKYNDWVTSLQNQYNNEKRELQDEIDGYKKRLNDERHECEKLRVINNELQGEILHLKSKNLEK